MAFRKRAEAITPLWLIVGLGNPGPEYARTRHNVGWDVIDLLSERHKIKLDRAEQRARYGVGRIEEVPVALVKPLTFMNVSGEAVKPLMGKWSLDPHHLLVIADDLDLPVGKLRMREFGSHGGHNGHRSLIAKIGSDQYPRLKIGIGSVDKSQTVDHVLGRFNPEDRTDVDRTVRAAAETIEILMRSGMSPAMMRANDPL
ncbi:aminoacyl-tRNA hydrolase [bacterium]|nr:MAG: aminoacyl-tRNA hydrolase [bacterium]